MFKRLSQLIIRGLLAIVRICQHRLTRPTFPIKLQVWACMLKVAVFKPQSVVLTVLKSSCDWGVYWVARGGLLLRPFLAPLAIFAQFLLRQFNHPATLVEHARSSRRPIAVYLIWWGYAHERLTLSALGAQNLTQSLFASGSLRCKVLFHTLRMTNRVWGRGGLLVGFKLYYISTILLGFYSAYVVADRQVLYIKQRGIYNSSYTNFFRESSVFLFLYCGLDTIYTTSLFFSPLLLSRGKRVATNALIRLSSRRYIIALLHRSLCLRRSFDLFFLKLSGTFIKFSFNFFILRKASFFDKRGVSKWQSAQLHLPPLKYFSEEFTTYNFYTSKYITDVADFSLKYFFKFYNRLTVSEFKWPYFLIRPGELVEAVEPGFNFHKNTLTLHKFYSSGYKHFGQPPSIEDVIAKFLSKYIGKHIRAGFMWGRAAIRYQLKTPIFLARNASRMLRRLLVHTRVGQSNTRHLALSYSGGSKYFNGLWFSTNFFHKPLTLSVGAWNFLFVRARAAFPGFVRSVSIYSEYLLYAGRYLKALGSWPRSKRPNQHISFKKRSIKHSAEPRQFALYKITRGRARTARPYKVGRGQLGVRFFIRRHSSFKDLTFVGARGGSDSWTSYFFYTFFQYNVRAASLNVAGKLREVTGLVHPTKPTQVREFTDRSANFFRSIAWKSIFTRIDFINYQVWKIFSYYIDWNLTNHNLLHSWELYVDFYLEDDIYNEHLELEILLRWRDDVWEGWRPVSYMYLLRALGDRDFFDQVPYFLSEAVRKRLGHYFSTLASYRLQGDSMLQRKGFASFYLFWWDRFRFNWRRYFVSNRSSAAGRRPVFFYERYNKWFLRFSSYLSFVIRFRRLYGAILFMFEVLSAGLRFGFRLYESLRYWVFWYLGAFSAATEYYLKIILTLILFELLDWVWCFPTVPYMLAIAVVLRWSVIALYRLGSFVTPTIAPLCYTFFRLANAAGQVGGWLFRWIMLFRILILNPTRLQLQLIRVKYFGLWVWQVGLRVYLVLVRYALVISKTAVLLKEAGWLTPILYVTAKMLRGPIATGRSYRLSVAVLRNAITASPKYFSKLIFNYYPTVLGGFGSTFGQASVDNLWQGWWGAVRPHLNLSGLRLLRVKPVVQPPASALRGPFDIRRALRPVNALPDRRVWLKFGFLMPTHWYKLSKKVKRWRNFSKISNWRGAENRFVEYGFYRNFFSRNFPAVSGVNLYNFFNYEQEFYKKWDVNWLVKYKYPYYVKFSTSRSFLGKKIGASNIFHLFHKEKKKNFLFRRLFYIAKFFIRNRVYLFDNNSFSDLLFDCFAAYPYYYISNVIHEDQPVFFYIMVKTDRTTYWEKRFLDGFLWFDSLSLERRQRAQSGTTKSSWFLVNGERALFSSIYVHKDYLKYFNGFSNPKSTHNIFKLQSDVSPLFFLDNCFNTFTHLDLFGFSFSIDVFNAYRVIRSRVWYMAAKFFAFSDILVRNFNKVFNKALYFGEWLVSPWFDVKLHRRRMLSYSVFMKSSFGRIHYRFFMMSSGWEILHVSPEWQDLKGFKRFNTALPRNTAKAIKGRRMRYWNYNVIFTKTIALFEFRKSYRYDVWTKRSILRFNDAPRLFDRREYELLFWNLCGIDVVRLFHFRRNINYEYRIWFSYKTMNVGVKARSVIYDMQRGGHFKYVLRAIKNLPELRLYKRARDRSPLVVTIGPWIITRPRREWKPRKKYWLALKV